MTTKQYGGNVNIEAAQSDGLPLNERRWAILSCAIGLGMASLDTAIANTALPTMASQLHTTPGATSRSTSVILRIPGSVGRMKIQMGY